MQSVGVRELIQQASKLLRLVRDEGEAVEITSHGKVIAYLVSARMPTDKEENLKGWWSDLDQLTAEISACWPANLSASDAVKEARREL